MKAAVSFVHGTEDERYEIAAGQEIPEEIEDDISEDLILEHVIKSDPGSLSKEQLLELLGADPAEAEGEFDEEEFRDALGEFKNKDELVDWAEEMFGVEFNRSDTRPDLEDQIVALQLEDDEE